MVPIIGRQSLGKDSESTVFVAVMPVTSVKDLCQPIQSGDQFFTGAGIEGESKTAEELLADKRYEKNINDVGVRCERVARARLFS
jgi:hypothetical protein